MQVHCNVNLSADVEMNAGPDSPRGEKKDYNSHVWYFCGRQTTRSAIVFLCQILILYIAIITCFVNLSVKNGPSELWITLLSVSLGSILPSPKVKKAINGEVNPLTV